MDRNLEKLIKIFNKLKIELRYINTKDKLTVPYAIYRRLSEKPIYADNKRYFSRLHLMVEVYFDSLKKQYEFEELFERELEENRFSFIKSEDIELDKNVTMTYYEITGGI